MKHSTKNLINKSFIEFFEIINHKTRGELRDLWEEFENIAVRAGQMAAYIEEREGYGCGDQGHKKALKALNRAGRIIQTKAFRYNGYHDLIL